MGKKGKINLTNKIKMILRRKQDSKGQQEIKWKREEYKRERKKKINFPNDLLIYLEQITSHLYIFLSHK